ncbi:MAG: hypothetical protein JXA20_10880 [Spirochaetes bacterium]|nr:hypothetical protein [Spirochaetota bacterium]
MSKQYQSGIFCRTVQCERHAFLENKSGEDYLRAKREHCRDCNAWMFFSWLNDNSWQILHRSPEMSPKELAARLRGMDPAAAADLTLEDILSL